MPTALDALHLPLLATSSHAEHALHDGRPALALRLGDGPRRAGRGGRADGTLRADLRIPQPGGEESLNVAAAAAVCLYESARQRSA